MENKLFLDFCIDIDFDLLVVGRRVFLEISYLKEKIGAKFVFLIDVYFCLLFLVIYLCMCLFGSFISKCG